MLFVCQDLFDHLEKGIETLNLPAFASTGQSDNLYAIKDASVRHDMLPESNETGTGKQAVEKGSKKKKGKSTGNTKVEAAESDPDYQELAPTKSKKNQKKGKAPTSSQLSDSKLGLRKDDRKEDSHNAISEAWLIPKIMALIPDLEEQGPQNMMIKFQSSDWRSVCYTTVTKVLVEICRHR